MVTLRIAVFALAASLAAHPAPGESHHLSTLQAALLASLRQHALAYTSTLPDFVCTQVTQRDSKQSGTAVSTQDGIADPVYGPSDTVVEKLSFFHQKEHYQLVSINGKPATAAELKSAAGAASSGDFGTALRVIFLSATGTTFSFHRDTHLRGRQVLDIEFHVPKSAGTPILDRNSRKAVIVPYRGHIYVDAATLDILRYTTQFQLPGNFAIQSAFRTVDYGPVTIAGKLYNLPAHEEVKMESGSYSFLNKIDFTDYHEYQVQAIIRYGTAALLPPPTSATPAPSAESQSQPPTPTLPQPSATQPAAAQSQPSPVAASNIPSSPSAAPSAPAGNHPASAAPISQPSPAAETATLPHAPAPGNVPTPPAAPQFQLKVASDLVLVPVVVLDAGGHAVTHLTRDDFQLFDKGKRQKISDFTVLTSTSSDQSPRVPPSSSSGAQPPSAPPTATFLVYFFDDLHLNAGDLIRSRNAVQRQLNALPPHYHVAILSTSGLVEQTFTPDPQKLLNALAKLKAQPLGGGPAHGRCPHISAYTASMLEIQGGLDAQGVNTSLSTALVADTMACLGLSPGMPGSTRVAAQALAQTARDLLQQSGRQSRQALLQLRDVIHWIAPAPGRKLVILISSGFLLDNAALFDTSDLLDDAVRNQVILSALDARGVYAQDPIGNIQDPGMDPEMAQTINALKSQEASALDSTLGAIAYGAGGFLFHNNNDLFAGLQRLAAPPACSYMLAFKPQHLKRNGSFHSLTVKLTNGKSLTIQARRGYFATRQP